MAMKICLLLFLSSCEPEKCIERENYYLSFLPHEYNILPKAGSSLGRKHSDKTKTKISDALKGNKPSDDTRRKMSEAKKGNTNSKNHPNSQKIEVTDLQEKIITTYNSMGEAARALNLPSYKTIANYILCGQTKPYKGRFTFKIDQ